jgi:hypothetical protein
VVLDRGDDGGCVVGTEGGDVVGIFGGNVVGIDGFTSSSNRYLFFESTTFLINSSFSLK